MNLNKLVEKWGDLLKEGSDFKNEKVKKTTALMLENQANYLMETGAWTQGAFDPAGGYATSGEFHKIAVPMVRRTFPELVAHDIVGVQPLTGPVGLAFALRFRAGQAYDGIVGTEVGYNTIDSDYSGSNSTPASGGMTTEEGERLGSNSGTGIGVGLGIGSGEAINELNFTVEKAQVEATTRKLRSRWSLEVAQDLKAMHGLDLEEEMMDVLAYEITAEIDREIIGEIRDAASTDTWDYDSDPDGRWEAEKYRNLWNKILRRSNDIATNTRRGAGNFLVVSPSVAAAIETMPSFTIAPVPSDVNTAVTGVSRIGSLDGRMTVYRDTFVSGDEVLIGYKGPSEYDTGIIYLPYIQLLSSKATFEDSFNPTVGLMSRYAIHSHIFGASNYYYRITVSNLP